MDFKQYLQTIPPQIETKLLSFLDKWRLEIAETSEQLLPLADQFIEASKGGKRLRGSMVLLGYELAGGTFNEDILKIALAYEVFQTAILAHDDIIDKSPTRRGRPTIYQAMGGDHYAISQTICLGDLGIPLATDLIMDTQFAVDDQRKATLLFMDMVKKTVYGEMLDVELPHLSSARKEDDVYTIHRLKTAYYSFVYPLQLGALFMNSDENFMDKLAKFGEDLGIAFQIQDDILGIFGDEKTLGKSVTSDIEEGKNTLLIIEALKNANTDQRDFLNKYYGVGQINSESVEQIRQIFKDTGALDFSKKKAGEYIYKAKEVIPSLTNDTIYQNLLIEMADFLVERKK